MKINDIINVEITSIKDFGAFCNAVDNPGYTGLIHISEFSDYFVESVNDFVKVGDVIEVKVLSVDESKKQVKISYKATRPELLKNDQSGISETKNGFSTLKDSIDEIVEKEEI